MKIRLAIGIFLALAVIGAVQVASATDLRITCTAPTKNTDGTTISGAITYSIYGGRTGETKTKLATGTACDFTRTSVATGVQEYYVTATVGGIESAPSNTASVTVAPPTPNAPTGTVVVTVTIQVPVPSP